MDISNDKIVYSESDIAEAISDSLTKSTMLSM